MNHASEISDGVSVIGPNQAMPTVIMARHVEMGDLDTVRLYFVSGFRWMASAFENFLREVGHPLEKLLADGRVIPLVHAECDYARSVSLGDSFDVITRVERIGTTSVTIGHSFVDAEGEFGRGRTVHVWVEGRDGRPSPVPEWLRTSLTKYA